ncbi:hypothetical protein QWZ04_00020 [Vibrio tapetis subsp. quintayensis]|uniref:hypothetical protein n=1 Tax=Vibrio tapetis TaxID=52443 RepID=UPI0025B56760|nr:hypothetical protein [Vibrio tapetis]MDN3678732.1 hypothetical protein [Vibrio tapetis subsp. quintayensis]
MDKRLSLPLTLIIAVSSSGVSAKQSELYGLSGFADFSNGHSSESTWITTFGYSYYLSSFLALDVGYNSTVLGKKTFENSDVTRTHATYSGWRAGIKVQQDFTNFSVFSRAAASYNTLEKSNYGNNDNTLRSYSGLNPYFSLGASMPAFVRKDLFISFELSHETLEQGFSANGLAIGRPISSDCVC